MTQVTVADLFDAGRKIARIIPADYDGYPQAMQADINSRRRQRESALRLCRQASIKPSHRVPPGEYGRLAITETGEIDYTVGQYAATEYYLYVEKCLSELRRLRNTV